MSAAFPASQRTFSQTLSAICFGAAVFVRLWWPLFNGDASREFRYEGPAFLSIGFTIPLLATVHSLYRGNRSALWLLLFFSIGPIISLPGAVLKAGVQLPVYLLTFGALSVAGFWFALKPSSPDTDSTDEKAVLYHSRRTNFFQATFFASVLLYVAGTMLSQQATRPGAWSERLAADPFAFVVIAVVLWLAFLSIKTLIRPSRLEVTVFRNGISYFGSLSIHGLSVREWIPIEQVKTVRYSREFVSVVIADRESIKIPRNTLERSGLDSAITVANRRIKVIDELDG